MVLSCSSVAGRRAAAPSQDDQRKEGQQPRDPGAADPRQDATVRDDRIENEIGPRRMDPAPRLVRQDDLDVLAAARPRARWVH